MVARRRINSFFRFSHYAGKAYRASGFRQGERERERERERGGGATGWPFDCVEEERDREREREREETGVYPVHLNTGGPRSGGCRCVP